MSKGGHLSIPHPGKFPIMCYTYDTILIMPTCSRHLLNLKKVLQYSSISTGLVINFSKPSLIPINLNAQKSYDLYKIFSCAVISLPFTYLELQLGATNPP